MVERRAYARKQKYFAVNITEVHAKGKELKFDSIKSHPKFFDESGLDISPGGIGIMCSKTLPATAGVRMKMMFPARNGFNRIAADGTVRWSREVKGRYKPYFQIGISLKEIGAAEKKAMMDFWERA